MNDHDISADEVYADALTWREQEVLVLLAEHLTNREIAERLHLAESTVKDYVGKILSKLYVKNRRQAVERAKTLGLLDPGAETMVMPPANLPAEATPFVGRRHELMEIQRLLVETRLLTLTGPGGIGKTRLALKAAREAAADFENGCFFVPLAPIPSVEYLIQTVAEGVKCPLATQEDPQRQLLRYLRGKQLLLVMDNFEHLLDGVGIVSEILQAAPAIKVLATSREKLNLLSETNLNIGGMGLPAQIELEDPLNYDAITLFVQSARKVCPGFDPSPDELALIVNICCMVGGMPLGIELSAAWQQILTVDEIADELEKGLDILTTEMRDAPLRHRSIRAVFDHSWSLLHETEREIFLCLSVFRGGFTRQAAQLVSGASLQQLAGLVDKSLLSHDPVSGRLEIHELLRQYAQERLEKTPQTSLSAQEAHAAYFAQFMEHRWDQLKGNRQMLAIAEIEADIENVRVAWRYYLEGKNAPQMWMLINGLWQVYWFRGWNHAGMELFGEAVSVLQAEQDQEAVALRAMAMAYQGYFMAWVGLPEVGYDLAEKSVAILHEHNHPEALGLAYECLSLNAYFLNRYIEETHATNEMFEIAAEIDDKRLLTTALYGASMIALIEEDYAEAERLGESSLELNEEIGNVIGSAFPLIALGHVALGRGDHDKARGYFQRCLKISGDIGFHWATANSCKYLGKVGLFMGEKDEAERYLVRSLRITNEIGFVRDIIYLLYDFACLRVAQNDLEGAVELLYLVIKHPASHQFRWLEGRIIDNARDLFAELKAELFPDVYSAALERGLEKGLDGAVAEIIGQ